MLTLGLRATVLGAPGLVLRFPLLITLGAAGLSEAGRLFRLRGTSDDAIADAGSGAGTGALPKTLRQSTLPIIAYCAIPATFEITQ